MFVFSLMGCSEEVLRHYKKPISPFSGNDGNDESYYVENVREFIEFLQSYRFADLLTWVLKFGTKSLCYITVTL